MYFEDSSLGNLTHQWLGVFEYPRQASSKRVHFCYHPSSDSEVLSTSPLPTSSPRTSFPSASTCSSLECVQALELPSLLSAFRKSKGISHQYPVPCFDFQRQLFLLVPRHRQDTFDSADSAVLETLLPCQHLPTVARPDTSLSNQTISFRMDVNLLVGQMVDVSYNPTYVVLSYLVSVIGCWTALELLHRRTSSRGFYNWSVAPSTPISLRAMMTADITKVPSDCGCNRHGGCRYLVHALHRKPCAQHGERGACAPDRIPPGIHRWIFLLANYFGRRCFLCLGNLRDGEYSVDRDRRVSGGRQRMRYALYQPRRHDELYSTVFHGLRRRCRDYCGSSKHCSAWAFLLSDINVDQQLAQKASLCIFTSGSSLWYALGRHRWHILSTQGGLEYRWRRSLKGNHCSNSTLSGQHIRPTLVNEVHY